MESQEIIRRTNALKRLQLEYFNIETQFYKDVHALEAQYGALYNKLFEKRYQITSGLREPSDDECSWPNDDRGIIDLASKLAATSMTLIHVEPWSVNGKAGENGASYGATFTIAGGVSVNEVTGAMALACSDIDGCSSVSDNLRAFAPIGRVADDDEAAAPAGLPNFWLDALRGVSIIADMIKDHDEPILSHLQDIRVTYPARDGLSFILEFYFSPNKYFTDNVLTKTYNMALSNPNKNPLNYDGPQIVSCKGCTIDWLAGKNVTVKSVRKAQKVKGLKNPRKLEVQVKRESFFNFFSPPLPTNDDQSEEQEELSDDYSVGTLIANQLIPRAVLYYTGEVMSDDELDLDSVPSDDLDNEIVEVAMADGEDL